MIIDVDQYKVNKPFVQRWFLEKGNGDIGNSVSLMAITTGVRCIDVAFWIGEVTNWHPDTLQLIDILTKYYGYTEIKNKPERMPS